MPATSLLPGIPVHLTDFIGRDREIHDVAALVQRARLVTLTGGGGSGKTRLAAEVASRSRGFERVVWVDLASLNDPELLVQHLATTLHAPEHKSLSALQTVIDAIEGEAERASERILVVLDSCEHVVDACAELVDALLRACPRLTVLATSREPLGVASESAWLVPPLGADDAQKLFVDRARAAQPAFALTDSSSVAVREICRRLDGIPLAIELAAARSRVLSAEQIASRLDDVFRLLSGGSRTALPRHRTLRATMDWSYALLGAREQTLLRRLAVFAGPFGLDAVEVVCTDESIDVEDILDGVAALVDKSLVVMEAVDAAQARYRLLETVRQYAREQLDTAGETARLERAHAEHFLAVVETAAPDLVGGPKSLDRVAAIATDQDNVRAALTWAVSEESRAELAQRFVGALFWFWYATGQFREARQFTDRALGMSARVKAGPRGRALVSSGLLSLAQGRYEQSIAHFEEAILLLKEAGDSHSIAIAKAKCGAARLLGGDLEGAIPILDEALGLTREYPRQDVAVEFAKFWRSWAAYRQDDYESARELIAGTIASARKFNLFTALAHGLVTLSRIELALGNIEEACHCVLEGLELEVTIRDGWGIALGLDTAAFAAAKRGRYEEAARLRAGTEAHRQRLAVALPSMSPVEDEKLEARLRAKLGSRFDAVSAAGRALSTDALVEMGLAEAARHTSEYRAVVSGEVSAMKSPTRLRVLALGPLQVFIGDKVVEAAAWGSARPRELFVYLLMHPEGRTKEQVGLAFWPDLSSAQLRNNFHVTLHRLRKALGGSEWVTLAGERYRVDPALLSEFDALAFEREARDARRALERGEKEAASRLERAVSRYRGDFLDGEPAGDWHVEHRERLQKLYVDSLMLLGERYEVEERHAKAAEVYGRALARDELHEDALLALLRCHAAQGERSQALRLYRRFADRMRAELGASPREATVRFVEQIQRV